ncbi:hypothetical protein Afil01_52010 [Actinorhabdospora filicis]|uniref:DUF4282 domain-containing protein n=1 Tax=Actinorhabdospora filicis TaxID=1785913 RepID=A0A9W6SQZ8_9ACTN|nr:DUF4282 domain-containing protein [Actinorhabdospora filicis]GLZ80394.1 hypothetical protein Afil01_52010 [Actinorhabdospora filicis]
MTYPQEPAPQQPQVPEQPTGYVPPQQAHAEYGTTYGAPPPTGQYAYVPQQPPQAAPKTAMTVLFDFTFAEYSPRTLLSMTYILGLVALVVGFLVSVIAGFAGTPLAGVVALVAGAPMTAFLIFGLRMLLEFLASSTEVNQKKLRG